MTDISGNYLAVRQGGNLTPYQQLMSNKTNQAKMDEKKVVAKSAGFDMGDIASDIAGGVIEAPRQIVGGVLDATKELAQVMESIIPLGTVGGDEVTEESFVTADEPRTTTGGLVRGVSQFVTGFLPATKAIKGIGVTSKAAQVLGGGAIADAFVFDPHEQRLSNLVEEFPALSNPVTSYLEAKPDDTEAEGRFKNAVEGMGLGVAVDGFVKGLKVLRANRIANAEQRALNADREAAEKLASSKDITVKDDVLEGEFIPFEQRAATSSPEFGVGAGKAGDEAAQNINLNNIDSTDQVDNLINSVAAQDAPKINEARREAITFEETERLADDLGMTVDQLLDRRKGQAFNAEQAVAARKILVASGENVFKLAEKARSGSDEDVAIFARALSQHRAIQAQVSGLTAEAGRALSSFRIQAKSAAAQERAINEALASGGGVEHIKDIASQVSAYDDVAKLNAFVSKTAKAKDMVYEAWINGLLSAPPTHVVNVLSNSLVAAWSVSERKVASLIGDALGGQSIPEGEASAQLKGMVEGAKDGMRLAWQTIKTGDPSDPLQKIENQSRKAITAENLNLSGVPGQFADFIGEVFRTPGRMLMAGDELFKAIGYRMELNAQAFRTGYNEGLRGDALAKRMTDIITNPPENLHIQAVDASRYQTFTKELGAAGKAVEGIRSKVPGAAVILPFIRTPTNIIKYVGERTPLAPLSKAVRDEFAAGGARRDLAMAKIATGSMTMAAAADFALSGDITGAGPTNPQMKSILRETGWQPYSIKIGDQYYSYSRLDPIGAFIGLAADVAEISGQVGEFDALDLTTASVVAVSQNVTSKTYLSGLAEFFDVLSSASSDPEANNKTAKRWLQRMAGSVIPSGVAAVERTISPELEATYGIIDKLKSRIPGYSDDLPPRRNIFGDPVVLSGGIGPDIMSPIYTSTDKKDPVADEIVAQQTLIRMPLRNISGVELTPQQYDRYIELYSGKDNKAMKRVSLKDKLSQTFRTPQYINSSDGQDGSKSLIIRSVFQAYKQAAQAQMLDEFPELRSDIILNKREKAEALMGM